MPIKRATNWADGDQNGIDTPEIPSKGLNGSQIADICKAAWNVPMGGSDYKDNDSKEGKTTVNGYRLVFLHIPSADISADTVDSIVMKTIGGLIIPDTMRGARYINIYTPAELNAVPFKKKTNQDLRINVPDIEYVDVVPYTGSLHSCNRLGCSVGKEASVG